ncbi:MAG: immunoglobulin domain-containing protein, partial [Clostridia bacterium]|nr:immunoglobulin domain-containing protein [Clostridia bacterium]
MSSGGETVSIEKELTTSFVYDKDTKKLSFNLKDLLPDGLSIGDSFLVSAAWVDALYQSTVDPSNTIAYYSTFTVDLRENDLEIIEHPADVSVNSEGDAATLTAKAENAKNAHWEKVSSSEEIITSGSSFDSSTGIATLTVPVDDYAEYVCCFTNGMGSKKTNKASVSILPSASLAEGETKDVEWSTESSVVYLNAAVSGPSSGKTVQRWYYRASATDEWEQIEKIEGKIDPDLYSNTLTVKDPASSDAGYYRMEADYLMGDGTTTTVSTGIYHVTVTSGFSSDVVTSINIFGMPEDMYMGDEAPSNDEIKNMLYTDDDRLHVTGFKWNGEDLTDGRFNTTAPRFEITLSHIPYKAGYDAAGRFTATLNGKTYYAHGTANSTEQGATVKFMPAGGIDAAAYWYVPQVIDSISMEQTYFFTKGDEVDLQLEPTVKCHKRHVENGVEHDYVSEFYLVDSSSFPLPSGLTLSADGRITGTVTQDGSTDPVITSVGIKISGNETEYHAVPIRFFIGQELSSLDLPDDKMLIAHSHTY